ncbi:helix-turn-helix transcriptional regulator [Bergeyella zoohelcum]|uniref:helix-turn-helix domain-containing protein n=1 Tax=Bergeyella zoohelcum TaxID=1015 RepID=UPI002A917BDD|nr:helix-turn-helix transcriptional regulator [Bergeyella zoohelcum]MDY6026234.1 helix-turn-helix transcriptional regulator [Bergeyella zoohelcum]
MNINSRIENIIEESGLSHAEFSEKVDVQRSSISHILSGRNKPSLDFLRKVKEAFPLLSWDWMIEGKGEMFLPKEEEKKIEKTTTPLPDLFSFVTDGEKENSTETPPSIPKTITSPISSGAIPNTNSSVEQKNSPSENIIIRSENNTLKKIKRVILLYHDGSFESYEMSLS